MFITVNLALLCCAVSFLIVPLVGVFAERADQIGESRAQLNRIRSLQRAAAATAAVDAAGVLLPGGDEGSASAALQSSLKAIVAASGAHFVAVRGTESVGFANSTVVAASLEFKGTIFAVREVVRTVEDHTPALIIRSAVVRGTTGDQDSELLAELTVQGLMQKQSGGAGGDVANARDGQDGRWR